MMANLGIDTWIRLIIWLAIGFCIYFGYSVKHSKLSGQSGLEKSNSNREFVQLDEKLSYNDEDNSMKNNNVVQLEE